MCLLFSILCQDGQNQGRLFGFRRITQEQGNLLCGGTILGMPMDPEDPDPDFSGSLDLEPDNWVGSPDPIKV